MSAVWPFVFSDVLEHRCHLLHTEVTTKQFDLSLCSSDRPLSGLASQTRSFAERVTYAMIYLQWGEPKGRQRAPSLSLCSLYPICHEHLLTGEKNKNKNQDLDFSSTSLAQPEQFISVA